MKSSRHPTYFNIPAPILYFRNYAYILYFRNYAYIYYQKLIELKYFLYLCFAICFYIIDKGAPNYHSIITF